MVGAVAQPTAVALSRDPRLHKAAQEFEAMLLADLLKIGCEEEQPDGESDQSCHGYDEVRNQAVATAMARNGGIGIAHMLEDKLGRPPH